MSKRDIYIITKLDMRLSSGKYIIFYLLLYGGVGALFAFGMRGSSAYFINFLLLISLFGSVGVMFSRNPGEFLLVNMTAIDIESYVIGKNVSAIFLTAILLFIGNASFSIAMHYKVGKGYISDHIYILALCPYLLLIMLANANYVARKNLMLKSKMISFLQGLVFTFLLGISLAAFVASVELISLLFAEVILLPLSAIIYSLAVGSTIDFLQERKKMVFDD